MDVERMESHFAKWLSDNCVDTNATVLQNVRLRLSFTAKLPRASHSTTKKDKKWHTQRIPSHCRFGGGLGAGGADNFVATEGC